MGTVKMARVIITLRVESDDPVMLQAMIEIWLASHADSRIEVEDVNTGDLVGSFSFGDDDFTVEVG